MPGNIPTKKEYLDDFDRLPKAERGALFDLVPPEKWVRLDLGGEDIRVPGVLVEGWQRSELNAILTRNGFSELPLKVRPQFPSMSIKRELTQLGVRHPLENPDVADGLFGDAYSDIARKALIQRFNTRGLMVEVACANLGLEDDTARKVYYRSHYEVAEPFIQAWLDDPVALAALEHDYGVQVNGLLWVPDKSQPHYRTLLAGQPEPRENIYARTEAGKKLFRLFGECVDEAAAYFAEKGEPFRRPALHFVYDEKSTALARSLSAAGIIEVNMHAYNPAYDYRAIFLHEAAHDHFRDYSLSSIWKVDRATMPVPQPPLRLQQSRPLEEAYHDKAWHSWSIEMRANRVAAEIMGSAKPIIRNYLQAQKDTGVLEVIPKRLTPALVNHLADIIEEVQVEQRIPRISEGYPYVHESMRDLAALDFGWDAKGHPPAPLVSDVQYRGRQQDMAREKG